MKILFSLILCLSLLLCSSVAYASGVDLASMSDDQLKELRASIDAELAARAPAGTPGALAEGDLGALHVAVLGAEYGKDYEGADCLIVTYAWSHNADKAKSFMFSFTHKLFQGGVECKSAMMVKDVNTDDQMLEIKSGATIEVKAAYVLRDSTSPAELELSELISFSDDTINYTFNLPL